MTPSYLTNLYHGGMHIPTIQIYTCMCVCVWGGGGGVRHAAHASVEEYEV